MQIEYGSDWMRPIIELIKCLSDINQPIRNEELGSIDYIIDNVNRKKLIRAMVDDDNIASPVYVDTIRATINELEEEKYDEAVIISKRITDSAYEIVSQQKNLEIITPKMKHCFSLVEVLSAVQKKTKNICKIKCGKAPETKEECYGKKGRTYVCEARRISDDATFHATMKWKEVLLEDFNNLCDLEKTMLEMNKDTDTRFTHQGRQGWVPDT
jgi:hypothetical protein